MWGGHSSAHTAILGARGPVEHLAQARRTHTARSGPWTGRGWFWPHFLMPEPFLPAPCGGQATARAGDGGSCQGWGRRGSLCVGEARTPGPWQERLGQAASETGASPAPPQLPHPLQAPGTFSAVGRAAGLCASGPCGPGPGVDWILNGD